MTKPTRDELIARAEELAPRLATRAEETEALRQLPDETVADLVDSGLVRIASPERYGGYSLDFDTVFEVGWRIAAACGSTGWCFMVASIHNWQLGLAPERAQEDYFADPNVLSSSAFVPEHGATIERIEDGFRLSGRWRFSSGVDYASWALLGQVLPGSEERVLFVVPRSDFLVEDTWFVSGLKGTGSKDVVIDEPIVVPEYRRVPMFGPGDAAARDRHGRGSYGAPIMSLMPFTLATPLIGIAYGALEEFGKRMNARRLPPAGISAATLPSVQLRLAESAAEVDAALTIVRSDVRELIERGARGDEFSVADRVRLRRDHAFVTKLAVSAVNRLFDAAGAHALFDDSPLQRMHRDVHAGSHQIVLGWDDNAERYGRVRLGLEPHPGIF